MIIESIVVYTGYFAGRLMGHYTPEEVPTFRVRYLGLYMILLPFLLIFFNSMLLASLLFMLTIIVGILSQNNKEWIYFIPSFLIVTIIQVFL